MKLNSTNVFGACIKVTSNKKSWPMKKYIMNVYRKASAGILVLSTIEKTYLSNRHRRFPNHTPS